MTLSETLTAHQEALFQAADSVSRNPRPALTFFVLYLILFCVDLFAIAAISRRPKFISRRSSTIAKASFLTPPSARYQGLLPGTGWIAVKVQGHPSLPVRAAPNTLSRQSCKSWRSLRRKSEARRSSAIERPARCPATRASLSFDNHFRFHTAVSSSPLQSGPHTNTPRDSAVCLHIQPRLLQNQRGSREVHVTSTKLHCSFILQPL